MTVADLQEPLLAQQTEEQESNVADGCSEDRAQTESDESSPGSDDSDNSSPENDAGDGEGNNDDTEDEDSADRFDLLAELVEMANLGVPLAVSFFCRMGMASTDSAFVGHISDEVHSPSTYLAAAALSDMVVNVMLVPPLAFNQVLNALVGQAIGSDNPKMAGLWLQQSMFWLASTMLPFLVGCFFVEPILLHLSFPHDVAYMAGVYAKYNVIWPIPNGLYQCMRFYFQAQGIPRPAMYNNIIFLFVNAFLNYLFVFGGPFQTRGLGFIGAAISLSVSRTMQSVVYFCYMFLYKKHHLNTWPGLKWEIHTWARTSEFLRQSVPNIGTLLFQSAASQATTLLLGKLGEVPIAASSALSTVTLPWSGTVSATSGMISSIRVGYHLGRGKARAARKSSMLVLYSITTFCVVMSLAFVFFKTRLLSVATSDTEVLGMASALVPAMLASNYLSLLVGNITSGVFSGMGRPVIATILSFGLELPLSIGGVGIYILFCHGNLLGVYWLQVVFSGIEAVIVLFILFRSDWQKSADEARARQESDTLVESESAPEEEALLATGDDMESPDDM